MSASRAKLGLATLAATLLLSMAGTGLGGASAATTLCSSAQETCEVAKRLAGGTSIHSLSTGWGIVNSTSNIICVTADFKAVTEAVSGEPLLAKIAGAEDVPVYKECKTLSGTACTITAVNAPYKVEIKWTEANSGTFKIVNGGAGVPGVDVKCGLLFDCRFTATVSYAMKGGSEAVFKTAGTTLTRAGMACPPEAQLVASYSVWAPDPLFVAHT